MANLGIKGLFAGIYSCNLFHKTHDLVVQKNMPLENWFFKHQAFQVGTAAEGHVHLSRREGAVADIEDHFGKRLPLAFVDRDRPGEFQGVLAKGPGGFGINLFSVLCYKRTGTPPR